MAATLATNRKAKPWDTLNPHERDYVIRGAQLRKLGFRNYPQFQKSPLWESIKAKLATKPENLFCARCDRDCLAYHHTHYKTMGKAWGIIPVCGGCHKTIHWLARVEKISILDATNRALKASGKREVEPFKIYHE